MKTRRQQIFEACEALAKAGCRQPSDFTYERLHQALEQLGYPRGNAQYLKKYRDEWQTLLGVVESNHNKSAHPVGTLDPLLNRLSSELSSAIEQQLRSEYEKEMMELTTQKQTALEKVEDLQIDLSELLQQFENLRHKTHEQQQYMTNLQARAESLIAENARLTLEHKLSTARIGELTEENHRDRHTHDMALNALTLDYENRLQTLMTQQEQTQQHFENGLSLLKELTENHRHDAIFKIDQLERAYQKLNLEYHSSETQRLRAETNLAATQQQYASLQKAHDKILSALPFLTAGQSELITRMVHQEQMIQNALTQMAQPQPEPIIIASTTTITMPKKSNQKKIKR